MNLYDNPDVGRPLSAAEYDRAADDGESAFEGGVLRNGARTRIRNFHEFRDGRCPRCGTREDMAVYGCEREARWRTQCDSDGDYPDCIELNLPRCEGCR